MTNNFSAYDVIEIAIEIEKNGAKLFHELAKRVRQLPLESFFDELAERKQSSISQYKKLLSRVLKEAPAEAYPGEYILYLKSLADEHTLGLQKAKKALTSMNTAEEALEFAAAMKKSSILYMQELLKHVNIDDAVIVQEMIVSKQQSLKDLLNMKKTVKGGAVKASKKKVKKAVKSKSKPKKKAKSKKRAKKSKKKR